MIAATPEARRPPSVRKNVAFNYLGQAYATLIGVLILPLYLKYLGAEAFGLVGFFTLLQSWMQLLNLGITPTLGREVARLRDSPGEAARLRTVVRSLETVFVGVAVLACSALFLGREWLALRWLSIDRLDPALVASCIAMMAGMVGFRWVAALHRSGINAYERQVWMNLADIVLATLRAPGALLLIVLSGGDILLYFGYQLLLSVVEQLLVSFKFHSLLPPKGKAAIRFSAAELRRVAPFALGVAYTGGIWIVVTQLDKLLLSKTLPLAEYGYFTLVATIAGGLVLLSAPVSRAVLPRMTALLAQRREAQMLGLYRRATRLVVCIVAPITLVLALFPGEAVRVWTGDAAAADWTARVLPLFVAGSGVMAVGAFQYYLQFAHGRLRQHVVYNTVSAAVSAPLIAYAAFRHGPVGVGWVWLGLRVVSFLAWTPYVHRLFAPGLHPAWLSRDVLLPAIAAAAVPLAAWLPMRQHFPEDRIGGLLLIGTIAGLAGLAALLAAFGGEARRWVRARV